MLIIDCPWCGPRDETEYSYGGEAHIVRPSEPESLSDEEWADYLFFRSNTKGWHREQWCHQAGCGRWFAVERHTVTYDIRRTYTLHEPPQGTAQQPGRRR